MEKVIYDILLVAMLVVSAFIIIAIFMQPSKQDGAADAFSGGTGELFKSVWRAGARFPSGTWLWRRDGSYVVL